MPQMTTPKELFVHELQDMYYAERTLTKVLPTLADEASDRELTRAFDSHLKETKKHVANLEKVFERIGERPRAERCPGIEGIKAEHDEFMREQGKRGSELVDAFLTGAASRTEHYEIAVHGARQHGPCARRAGVRRPAGAEPPAGEGGAEEGRVDLEADLQGRCQRELAEREAARKRLAQDVELESADLRDTVEVRSPVDEERSEPRPPVGEEWHRRER